MTNKDIADVVMATLEELIDRAPTKALAEWLEGYLKAVQEEAQD